VYSKVLQLNNQILQGSSATDRRRGDKFNAVRLAECSSETRT